jgi:hypothetical protein
MSCPLDWEAILLKIDERRWERGCDLLTQRIDFCYTNCDRGTVDFSKLRQLHNKGYMSLWPLALRCQSYLAGKGVDILGDEDAAPPATV